MGKKSGLSRLFLWRFTNNFSQTFPMWNSIQVDGRNEIENGGPHHNYWELLGEDNYPLEEFVVNLSSIYKPYFVHFRRAKMTFTRDARNRKSYRTCGRHSTNQNAKKTTSWMLKTMPKKKKKKKKNLCPQGNKAPNTERQQKCSGLSACSGKTNRSLSRWAHAFTE